MITLPGLIDIHVHLRDPGQTNKEDFTTGTAAALAGGFTTVFDMPNNRKPITTWARLQEKMIIAKKKILGDVGFYFGSLGDNLAEFTRVKPLVFGLKLYLNITTGGFIIDKKQLLSIYKAWSSEKPILLHSEEEMVGAIIDVVRKTGQRSHFCHISSRNELSQIMKAKQEGLPVTCGVTAHHLFLTIDDARLFGPYVQMKPSLKSRRDVDYLWTHLRDIDVIESDHAPHTLAEKESDKPPFGVPGLETTLPLLLTAVSEDKLELKEIWRLCYDNPRQLLKLPDIKETYIEVDEKEEYEINDQELQTKCGWSPFSGEKVRGRVKRVYIRGEKVYENRALVKPGWGTVLGAD
ncbi:hypothetical protein A3F03_03775 [Candidatus Roizmanbacteria bacterium RIFCSPHIGHO2_12_FULL_41_11]|uniref:Amidohydrolase-related domain-containing protein n=1 Tax=Candidatus Roizmanbacteria bacterium RIFCSPHIGHO2_12_FULL_41_11 TaxID=1802052 RepID=A0A1F7I2M8_9BACT|nr:MAG: hypothetical protein A3F03_03775 [Candidatus Roizmanbacteria bacterium RIFCSPHIGHO2_12_FULL_41_11]